MTQKALLRLGQSLQTYREIFDQWPEFEQADSEPEKLLALLDILEAFQDAAGQWLYTIQERSFSDWMGRHGAARLAVEKHGVCFRLAWDMCRAGAYEMADLDRMASTASKWLDRGHDEILTVLDFARFDYQRRARKAKISKNEATKKEPRSLPGGGAKNAKRRNGGTGGGRPHKDN
jgi:hypothetical protein